MEETLRSQGLCVAANWKMTTMPVKTTQLENGLTVLVETIPEVQSAAFAPNSKHFASGGADGSVRLWGVPATK